LRHWGFKSNSTKKAGYCYPTLKTNYFVSHRFSSWQVAPQQSPLPLSSVMQY
jgi:hypothetical protein